MKKTAYTRTHTIGNIYRIGSENYLLTAFLLNESDYAILVSLSSGNRWTEPIRVKDFRDVSQKEMNSLIQCGGDKSCKWKLIGSIENYCPEVSDTTKMS